MLLKRPIVCVLSGERILAVLRRTPAVPANVQKEKRANEMPAWFHFLLRKSPKPLDALRRFQ
jgi:hypothetical protein